MQNNEYRYLTKSETKLYRGQMHDWVMLKKFLRKLKNEFGFSSNLLLVGSAKRRLVIKRPGDEPYDFDYQIRISPNFSGKLDPRKINEFVFDYFQKLLSDKGYKIEDSTSAITIKKFQGSQHHSYDVAILSKNQDEKWQILKYDKSQNNYTWNILKDSEGFFIKYRKEITGGKIPIFRKEYLEMKKENWSLPVDEQLTSSQILVNATNKVIDNY